MRTSNIQEALKVLKGYSQCTRRKVGALVTVPGENMAWGGFNHIRAELQCDAGGCPRGQLNLVPPYSPYDDPASPGYCPAVHAEVAALEMAGERARGAWMHTTAYPCDGCRDAIAEAGIVCVVVVVVYDV